MHVPITKIKLSTPRCKCGKRMIISEVNDTDELCQEFVCFKCNKQKEKTTMTEREMFEKSLQRPRNFFNLSEEEQWEIDKQLGILDWRGDDLTVEDKKRIKRHYL